MSEDVNKEVPSVRFVEKKVDTSWKEEVRKERELAAQAAPSAEAGPTEASDATSGKTAPGKPAAAPQGKTGAGQPSRIFMNFLAQLVQQGLMQLGAVDSPFTGQREVDLEGAQFTIELLGVLQEKTKGNLVDQENRMFTEALRELQLHYVEVAQAVRQQAQKQAQNPQGPRGPKM